MPQKRKKYQKSLRKMQLNKSIEELADILNGKASNKGLFVYGINSLASAQNTDLSFFNNIKFKKELQETNAGVVLIKEKHVDLCPKDYIVVKDPYYAYSLVSQIVAKKNKVVPTIKESVKVGKESIVHKTCFIDDYVVIGDNVSIGENVYIHSGVKIEDNVSIDNDTTVHQNVIIKRQTSIGSKCEIHPNVVIGSDGFGYANCNEKWSKISQLGKVIIGNNVDIGANTTIDRGAIQDTIIKDGVKIDNQVQIGHNCIIKDNSIIAGCVGIAGSTEVGKRCKIGGAAMILGHLNLPDDTTISPGTLISKSIVKKGTTQTGIFPFFETKDWIKVTMFIKKLIRKRII
jgi:UDP-3-O-[3-hydroxymyristoyl] glucosamine N-acyltransferase